MEELPVFYPFSFIIKKVFFQEAVLAAFCFFCVMSFYGILCERKTSIKIAQEALFSSDFIFRICYNKRERLHMEEMRRYEAF